MAGKIQSGIILVLMLCMTALFCVSVLAAQEAAFRLDMDSLNLQKGVSSNITVSLMNAQEAKIISIDGVESFDIVSRNQSTSTSIINGEVTYQADIHYTIIPKLSGQFTLKATIEYNGQYYETNSLQVTVMEAADAQNSFAQDLFVKTVLSHDEAYMGEKIVVTYELYTRYNIENYGFTDYIAIDGVVAKDIPEDQLKSESVYVDGNRYAMYTVKQLIIDPIKLGECVIPAFNLQVSVIDENNLGGLSGFGAFGGSLGSLFRTATPRYLQTEEKTLLVKPLPSDGRPSDFSGIVGEMEINSQYSRTELNYGDSLTLQVEVSGNCNLDGLKNVITGEIADFTAYETHKNTIEAVKDGQYHVQKFYDIILVPEVTGDLEISPISYSYFSPASGKYERTEISGTTIQVLGEMLMTNFNSGHQGGSIETVMISQVNYADVNDGYFTIQMKKAWTYAALMGFVILLIMIVGLSWLMANKKKRNPELKSLYKQIMAAKDVNEIYNLFNAMIKHCYNMSLKANSKESVRKSITNSSLAAQVMEVMDYMESANVNDDKGRIYLKDKIKGIYNAEFR